MNKKIVQKIKYRNKESVRLDLFIVDYFGFSRSKAQNILKEGSILVNGKIEKPKYELKINDEVALVETKIEENIVNIPVIFEDNDLLIVDKPTGVSTHPAPGEKAKTVVDYFRDKLDFPKTDERAGVVHRLDKGTSGILVLAKNKESLSKIQSDFKNRRIVKEYIALICGIIEPSAGVINIPISRNMIKREKMSASSEGKEAITVFSTIERIGNKYTLLKLNPKTGRTHQLRVHLSALGYPIIGDIKYGKKSEFITRIFLHAAKIEFRHPKTNKKLVFESPLPKVLRTTLDLLRK